MSLFPPVGLLIFEILSQLIEFQDEILRILIKILMFVPTYWLRLRISEHKRSALGAMFIKIWVIFLPVRLFPPVCLLVLGKCSSLYVYSILYDYLVLKSKARKEGLGMGNQIGVPGPG